MEFQPQSGATLIDKTQTVLLVATMILSVAASTIFESWWNKPPTPSAWEKTLKERECKLLQNAFINELTETFKNKTNYSGLMLIQYFIDKKECVNSNDVLFLLTQNIRDPSQ